MKYILSLLIAITSLVTCGKNNEGDFPGKVKSSKTKHHIRIKGTKVFGVFPETYQYMDVLCRYQKSEKLYVQVMEMPGASFVSFKEKFNKEAIEAQGAEVDFLEHITINEFEGIYCEGPSKFAGETKIMLTFGDSDFMVFVVGILQTSDTAGKKELQEIFKSVYYDKSFKIDPLELAAFEFDTSITGFKYASTISNMFLYTEGGVADSTKENSIIILTMPYMVDYKAEMYLNDIIWRYTQTAIELENKEIKKKIIGEYSAFILETKVIRQNKKGIVYVVVLVGKDKSIVFTGTAFDDLDAFLIKYKRTVESIKIK